MSNAVTAVLAAPSNEAAAYFERKFQFETDCWDVHDALSKGDPRFVLLDGRSPKLFAQSHAPGAVNLPHGKITRARMDEWPAETLFVGYCAGPHCNGADRAALRLARLERRVKVMIGGMTGWANEGFAFARAEVAA